MYPSSAHAGLAVADPTTTLLGLSASLPESESLSDLSGRLSWPPLIVE